MPDSIATTSHPEPSPIRFQIKDILLLSAWSAVVAWCIASTGPASIRVVAQLFLIFLLSGVALFWFQKRKASSLALLTVWHLFALLFTLCSGSITASLYTLLLLIACLAIKALDVQSFRSVLYIFCFLSIICLSASIYFGYQSQQQLAEQRLRYPAIDLTQRLAYEASKPNTPAAPTLAPADQEFHYWGNRRLEKLHADTTKYFVMAQGFGVSRMDSVVFFHDGGSDRQPIPFDPTETETPRTPGVTPERSLEARHDLYVDSFAKSRLRDVFILEPRRKATGKVAHGFDWHPESNASVPLKRIELVSLHRFGEPRCYVSEYLPEMKTLRQSEIATRALDDFESQSLAKLWTDQNVVIQQEPTSTRMLGALRASQDCLECHAASKGELLGAFTYTLETSP